MPGRFIGSTIHSVKPFHAKTAHRKVHSSPLLFTLDALPEPTCKQQANDKNLAYLRPSFLTLSLSLSFPSVVSFLLPFFIFSFETLTLSLTFNPHFLNFRAAALLEVQADHSYRFVRHSLKNTDLHRVFRLFICSTKIHFKVASAVLGYSAVGLGPIH